MVVMAGLACGLSILPGVAHATDPASIPATNPQHFINFTYGVPGNFDEYKYTIKVDTAASTDDIYYGQYIYGKNSTGFYSGLQPHPGGKAGVRFSFFGSGAKPLDANCSSGADAGSGVTCGIDDLSYAVGRQYTIATKKYTDAGGTSYTGTITDDSTGQARTIGKWLVPSGYGGFDNSADAFIEKFGGVKTCADIPAVAVSYTGVSADGKPISFTPSSHKATDKPGSGIYTCSTVSNYTVSAPAAGSYTVTSTGV